MSGSVRRQNLVDGDRQGRVLAGGPGLIAYRDQGEISWPGQLNMVPDEDQKVIMLIEADSKSSAGTPGPHNLLVGGDEPPLIEH